MNRLLLLLFVAFLNYACNSKDDSKSIKKSNEPDYRITDSLARANPDSAFDIYNRAASNSTDSGYKGTWLQRMAAIQHDAGDFYGSNETTLNSLRYFNETYQEQFPNISYNYNLLARNYSDLGRYDDALACYEKTFQFSTNADKYVYQNNKAVTFLKKQEYDSAIVLFDSTIKEAGRDSQDYAMVLSNLARAHWLKDPNYPALPALHEAKQIRLSKNNLLGLNASYAHLSDYYAKTLPDSAFYYANKMYETAIKRGSAVDQVEALNKLNRLKSDNRSKEYFDKYARLSDSIYLARSNASSQFADKRYNIAVARANNLVLEKDNSQKRFRIIRQIIIIYSIIFLFVVAGTLSIIWYRKRKRIQDLQTKNAIRESELKTSQKVHDVVANGLYRILNELEHKEMIEKGPLLDNIELLYEQSRDISYEHHSTSGGETKRLKDLLLSFASADTRILLVGIADTTWLKLSPPARKELEFVLQELMVNMKKHSGAKNVLVRFAIENGDLKVLYQDDGNGLPAGFAYGNGLRNTETRIKKIDGTITFDGTNGFKAEISIPISTSK